MKVRQLIYLFTTLFLTSCGDKNTIGNAQNETIVKSNIRFPVKANYKNPDRPIEDTLIATVGKRDFLISPDGKLFWGQNPVDTIHLLTNILVEHAFLHVEEDTLFIFYTETDHEGATSRFEKINLATRQRILKAEIQGFNLGIPYIVDNFAYITAIGVVGKLDLGNGKYIYQYTDLYDRKKYSFNSFDTIVFKEGSTIFLSKNSNGKRMDSLIVNEKTGDRIIKN